MHDFANTVAWTAFWAFIAAIIIVPKVLRSRDQARMHETMRIAFEKGQPVPPELITALQTNVETPVPASPDRDLRRAIVLLAIGMGFVGVGYALWYGLLSVGEEGADIAAYIAGGCTAAVGAVPALIGLAYLILWLTRRNAPKV
jgi:hypothetical protein